MKEPSLAELARVIKADLCIEASFKRGKGEAGMDEVQGELNYSYLSASTGLARAARMA